MPLLRTKIALPDVVKIMHSRGYGDHHDGRYALAFNKKDPTGGRWKLTGEPKRVPAGGGVSDEQLDRILTHSESAVEAADRVEAVINGAEMLPLEALAGPQAAPIDTSVMEKMVENRTDSQIGRHLTPVIAVLDKLANRLEQLEAKIAAPSVPAKKKVGWPKGKRRKPPEEIPDISFGPRVESDVKQ